jgi:hypothetical protein
MKALILLYTALLGSTFAMAQDTQPSPFSFSGYLETYYTYDPTKPSDNLRPSFIYSHNRVNEINLNLGFVRASYNTERVRSTFSLATGTYMNANYVAEPGILKNIYEANVGIKISRKNNIWLDAGIMPSHIGWESAVGRDCWTLSRSLAAENSPYFETGLRAGYTSENGRWFVSLLVLNGWQRIQRVDGNSTPAFGSQVTFKPNASITLNSSTFIGNDKPDSAKQMRYFHDFYGVFQLSRKIGVIAGFDIGAEQKTTGSSKMNVWYTPAIIVKYAVTSKMALALRTTYYDDRNGVVVATGTANGFRTWEYSANFDYSISPNALWRFEVRNLSSKDLIFKDADQVVKKNDVVVSTSLSIGF